MQVSFMQVRILQMELMMHMQFEELVNQGLQYHQQETLIQFMMNILNVTGLELFYQQVLE